MILFFQNYHENEISKNFKYHKKPGHLTGLVLRPKCKESIVTDGVRGGSRWRKTDEVSVNWCAGGLRRESRPSCSAFGSRKTEEMARKGGFLVKEIPGLRKGEGTISLGCRRGRVSVKTGDAYPIFKAAHLKEGGVPTGRAGLHREEREGGGRHGDTGPRPDPPQPPGMSRLKNFKTNKGKMT